MKIRYTIILFSILLAGLLAQDEFISRGRIELAEGIILPVIDLPPGMTDCGWFNFNADPGYEGGHIYSDAGILGLLQYLQYIDKKVEVVAVETSCSGGFGWGTLTILSIHEIPELPDLTVVQEYPDECSPEVLLDMYIPTMYPVVDYETMQWEGNNEYLIWIDIYQDGAETSDSLNLPYYFDTPPIGEYEFTITYNYWRDNSLEMYQTVQGDFLIEPAEHTDINSDGQFNVLDIVAVVQIILETIEVGAYEYCLADCNGDEIVDIIDIFCYLEWMIPID